MRLLAFFLLSAAAVFAQPTMPLSNTRFSGTNNVVLDSASLKFGTTTPGNISGATGAITFTSAGTNQPITLNTAGTNAVILPSTTAGGLKVFNTVDQTTNYEGLQVLWSGNIGIIQTIAAGSGSVRALRLVTSGGTSSTVRATGSSSGVFQLAGLSTSTASNVFLSLDTITNTATSGTNIGFQILPTYNQSASTAGNTDLKIARTETSLGSGVQAFLDFYAGSAGVTQKFTLLNTGKISNYAGGATAGYGVPAVVAAGRVTAQSGANASVSTYTVGSADGSFEVSANVNVTTSTTHSFTVTCTYTDESNSSRTLTMGFTQLSGATFLTAITNVTGAGPYEGLSYHIRCKAGTTITFATTGTFTTVAYNAEGIARQLL